MTFAAMIALIVVLLMKKNTVLTKKNLDMPLKPVLTSDQAFGMIKTNKHATKKDYKEAVRRAVVEKFRKRGF